ARAALTALTGLLTALTLTGLRAPLATLGLTWVRRRLIQPGRAAAVAHRVPATGLAAAGTDRRDDRAAGGRGRGLLHGGLLELNLEVEQAADGLFLDALNHLGEHVVALALVPHQRVTLSPGAQADAVPQVVHLVQVLAPLAVQHRQHDPPLELAHHFGP